MTVSGVGTATVWLLTRSNSLRSLDRDEFNSPNDVSEAMGGSRR
jgi:hypothetical protein